MRSSFKPGDRVRRIANFGPHTVDTKTILFSSNTTYTVEASSSSVTLLKELPGRWGTENFELAKPERNLPPWF